MKFPSPETHITRAAVCTIWPADRSIDRSLDGPCAAYNNNINNITITIVIVIVGKRPVSRDYYYRVSRQHTVAEARPQRLPTRTPIILRTLCCYGCYHHLYYVLLTPFRHAKPVTGADRRWARLGQVYGSSTTPKTATMYYELRFMPKNNEF